MKNLLLIRHAKSSWDDPLLSDQERPLNKRGKRDAPAMGLMLKEKGLHPDLILSSPAKRALKTAKLIAEAIDYPKKQCRHSQAVFGASFSLIEVPRNQIGSSSRLAERARECATLFPIFAI